MTINLSKALKAFQQRQARYLPSGGRAVACDWAEWRLCRGWEQRLASGVGAVFFARDGRLLRSRSLFCLEGSQYRLRWPGVKPRTPCCDCRRRSARSTQGTLAGDPRLCGCQPVQAQRPDALAAHQDGRRRQER